MLNWNTEHKTEHGSWRRDSLERTLCWEVYKLINSATLTLITYIQTLQIPQGSHSTLNTLHRTLALYILFTYRILSQQGKRKRPCQTVFISDF